MALQICSRCRRRRVKCDLQLPSCKNCRIADVECLYWDESLGQEIPCSYLYSLRQKAQRLKLAIQSATNTSRGTLTDPWQQSESTQEHGYYLTVDIQDDLPSTYLGPGNSARLSERLLKYLVSWHSVNNIAIPGRLLPDEISPLAGTRDLIVQHRFPMLYDQRKVELHTLVPPSTQRSIIEHYLKVVSPEYALLSAEREPIYLAYENPLKWRSTNRDNPDAVEISIVFAISSALVSRDLDPTVSGILIHCKEDLYKLSQKSVSLADPIQTTRLTCAVLCALALCEFISPTSNQLWDLLGRASSTIEHLREGYYIRNLNLDKSFYQLERSVLKLESSVALHFRRPSQFCKIRLRATFEDSHTPNTLSNDLKISVHLHNIAHQFTISPRPMEEFFESLIPQSLQVDPMSSDINIISATLYTALHPLFTSSDIYPTNHPSSRLFDIVSRSASAVIDHFARLDKSNKIISIWLAADRVFEAGVVWATYLIRQCHVMSTGKNPITSIRASVIVSPILKVSALLASFAARWRGGSVYVDAWETLVQLLWNIL
ncbi:hypothetical protein F5884DRAFT_9373 [Xylogone sp. PMI_703]|nr:hypothetical protein F5884DRAFT_9373 [Xylogone sp. PMI_703]